MYTYALQAEALVRNATGELVEAAVFKTQPPCMNRGNMRDYQLRGLEFLVSMYAPPSKAHDPSHPFLPRVFFYRACFRLPDISPTQTGGMIIMVVLNLTRPFQ